MPSEVVEVGRGKSDGVVCVGGDDRFVCILVFVYDLALFSDRENALKEPNTSAFFSREVGIAAGGISLLLCGGSQWSYEHNKGIGRGDGKAKRDLAPPRMYAG